MCSGTWLLLHTCRNAERVRFKPTAHTDQKDSNGEENSDIYNTSMGHGNGAGAFSKTEVSGFLKKL